MSNNSRSDRVWANGKVPDAGPAPHMLGVTPGWFATMKIGLIAGRDFRESDVDPQAAIVNESFARIYFDGQNPVGRSFEVSRERRKLRYEIEARCAMPVTTACATPFVRPSIPPFAELAADGTLKKTNWATIIARSASPDPLMLAPGSARLIHRTHPEFRVASISTQAELVRAKMIR